MQRVRAAGGLLWRTIDRFFGDGCPGMAASLSFYTFFSLPALLALLLLVVGQFVDPDRFRMAITTEIGSLIGRGGAQQVGEIIAHARQSYVDTSFAAALGVLAVLFGASTAFAQLQQALNRAWNVKPDPARGQIRNFLAKRIFSFGVVLAVAFLLLVSLALSTGLAAFGDMVTSRLGLPKPALKALAWMFSFAVVSSLFAVMYKVLPDARIAWRDVWTGAIGSALFFVLGKALIGYYLGRSDPASAYGAAGSLAVILIWVYYSSMIVLFGAEFTRVWAEEYGRGVVPEKGAVEVVHQERKVKEG